MLEHPDLQHQLGLRTDGTSVLVRRLHLGVYRHPVRNADSHCSAMNSHVRLFLWLLACVAVAGLTAGCVLAISGYSSAGPFAVASACVGVLGTLAAENIRKDHDQ